MGICRWWTQSHVTFVCRVVGKQARIMQDKESGRGASERQGVRDRSREGGDREKRRDDDYDRSSGREKARDMTGSRSSRDYDRERERDRERGRERDREREWEREGGRGSGRYDGRGGQRSRHQDRPGRDPEAGKDGDPTQNQGSKCVFADICCGYQIT